MEESHRGNGKVVYDKDPKKLVEKVIDLVKKKKSRQSNVPAVYQRNRNDGRPDNRGRRFRFALRVFPSGRFWGTVHLAVSLFIVYLLHQWYGEVSFYTKGKHRFVGYVEMYLGKKAKFFSMLTTIGAYYGSLLVYAIMGGIFLANFTSLFNGQTVFFLTLLFLPVAD